MSDGIRAVSRERRHFHLGRVRVAENLAGLQPSRAQLDTSDGQHLDLLDVGYPLRTMLDIGEHVEHPLDRSRNHRADGNRCHGVLSLSLIPLRLMVTGHKRKREPYRVRISC